MLSLLLAPPAITGEVMLPISIEAASSMAQMQGELSSLLSQLNRMRAASRGPVRTPPSPCAEDVQRLRCPDAACLRRAADDLTPACAAFLLTEPTPSPAPTAEAATARPQPAASASSPLGLFTFVSSSSEGTRRVSARMGEGGPLMGPPLMPPELAEMLPPDMRALLGGLFPSQMMMPAQMPAQMMLAGPTIAIVREGEEEEEEEEEAPARHPCAAEMSACARDLGARDRPAIERCLLDHLPQLSHQCGCFVRQMVGSRATPPVAAAARVQHGHAERAAPRARPDDDDDVIVVVDGPLPPPHPAHRLSCLFFLASLFLFSLMLARACLAALCAPPKRARANIVMVPPTSAPITALPPLPAKTATKA